MSQFDTWEMHYSNIGTARSEGFEIVYGSPDELLLDLDSPEQTARYEEAKKQLQKDLKIVSETEWVSKSGNKHVVVKLNKDLSIELRIALQVCLGSDPNRGICQIRQILEKANNNVLFRPRPK